MDEKENKINWKIIRTILSGVLLIAIIVFVTLVGGLSILYGILVGIVVIARHGYTINQILKREKLLEEEGYTDSPLVPFKKLDNPVDYNSDTIKRIVFTTVGKIKNNSSWSEAVRLYEEIAPRISTSGSSSSGINPIAGLALGFVAGKLVETSSRVAFLEMEDGSYRFSNIDAVSVKKLRKFLNRIESQKVEITLEFKVGHSKIFWILITILVLLVISSFFLASTSSI